MKKYLFVGLLLAVVTVVYGQDMTISPALMHDYWSANWISCPGVSQRAYGVYHFRKTFALSAMPGRFIVHVSADNRYRLFVNGKPVCFGPARGDLAHWNFETIDLTEYLKAGENTVAALVWNMGEYGAVGQISNQTAFLVQGDSVNEQLINTDPSWKVVKDSAYRPCSIDMGSYLHSYYVVGPGDEVDGSRYPWGWEQPGFQDAGWAQAVVITRPVTTGNGSDNLWTLTPRTIPLMESTMQRIPQVRRMKGGGSGEVGGFTSEGMGRFLTGSHPVTILPHESVVMLLDQGYETIAYPEVLVSKGKGAVIKITYAEALFDSHRQKGNRNEIEGKEMRGDSDVFRPDGGDRRLFRPLWMRTYRYLQLEVIAGDEEVILNDLYGIYTGYPFVQKAGFSSNDSSLRQLWDIGWRTARLCAGENYFDCPYYEQLQYEADTRIQSLISLYIAGDDRLMRKAITDFFNSRVAEGLTQGRYPSSRLQVIPPFSLFWISMLYDYWMHRTDDAFIRHKLFAVKDVLGWYEKRIDPDKQMLGPMDWWNFVDWNHQFPGGTPDGANDGNSSVITLQLVYTLQQAAALFNYYTDTAAAGHYTRLAARLAGQTYKWCFDPVRGEMANTPGRNTFSQHASIMGVLTGSIAADRAQEVMHHVLDDSTLSQATFYYRFYLTRALVKAGMGNLYYSSLKPWREMVDNGLTTFAENPDPTRSDCHAWSASPIYDFLATICGIMPAAPGFKVVSIRPAFGELKEVHGMMPHPNGVIRVDLERKGVAGVKGEIELPPGVSGFFYWNGRKRELHAGKQAINI